MLATVASGAVSGIDGLLVQVEVDVANGLPGTHIVGLGDIAIHESKERVRSAIRSAGFSYPSGRVTINLAPADLRKAGPAFDLPIALGILAANKQVDAPIPADCVYVGELALDGTIRPITGMLPIAMAAKALGLKLAVPSANWAEAALVDDLSVWAFSSLAEAIALLKNPGPPPPRPLTPPWLPPTLAHDLSEVKGQLLARRGLELAAAGGHNCLLVGPPGSGKTMLARRLPSILPPLTRPEALDVTRVYSIAGELPAGSPLIDQRPFRSPHHSVSAAGLIGGTANALPGEVSLALHGLLFLDELPEFSRNALEVLRQPLEDGHVLVSRARCRNRYPAVFTLIAAMNPCPCGFAGDSAIACSCSQSQIHRYWSRISGPLLDRIDLQIGVPRLPAEGIVALDSNEASQTVLARVLSARDRQRIRFAASPGVYANANMQQHDLTTHCKIDARSEALVVSAIRRLGLSSRGVARLLKVARTIADLADSPRITTDHICEAMVFRRLELPAGALSGGAFAMR